MFEQYGKATLFDYSYRYFYADGYGKDYRIMNMNDWNDDELLNMYLTAYLMCLYEQIKIYEGDGKELVKLLQTQGFLCETKAFGTASLFATINEQESSINLLIGSKKFTEGWSSWRVSAMGLMNVGRSEGSEIIQLFGRGVRLKGYKYSLKRSKMLDACYQEENIPKGLSTIETLNIFGVRADYMEAFKAYLEDEGLPTNEIDYEEIVIKTTPTVDLEATQLYLPKVVDGYNFKKSAVVAPAETDLMNRVTVRLDKYPKVDLLKSKNVSTSYTATRHLGKLTHEHLQWIDWTEVFFALQRMKAERGWYNMMLRIEDLRHLMAHPSWYELAIPEANLSFQDFGKNVEQWQDITISLLRGYIDCAYKKAKAKEEQKHLKDTRVTYYNIGVPEEYTVKVRNDQEGLIDHLELLQERLGSGSFNKDMNFDACFKALSVDMHLYKPLLFLAERDGNGNRPFQDVQTGEPILQVNPVALNIGEKNFVFAFRNYCLKHQNDLLAGKQVYLLRNESKKGMGFFEANNFYPDFILWILDGEKQYLTFIDPKGIRNLKGLDDPKIQLFKYLQTDVAAQVGNPNLVMNSFIVSNTPMEQVEFWAKEPFAKEEFAKNHVLFEDMEGAYLERMVRMIFTEL